MANDITNYKCPRCTGPVHYNGATNRLECDFCDGSFTIEEMEALYGKAEQPEAAPVQQPQAEKEPEVVSEDMLDGSETWDVAFAGTDWGRESQNLQVISCSSCGAQLIRRATNVAAICPYCGNHQVDTAQLSGSKKPDLIIPFQLDKNAAIAALKKHYQGKRLLPKAFTEENHIQEIQGVYVPFWLFDAAVDVDATYKASRDIVRNTPQEVITDTDHFMVHRSGTVEFKMVPVDGASKMPDGYMDSIEPYDYSGMKPFSMSYLPGFLADKYDVAAEDSVKRADDRCRRSALDAVQRTVDGYNAVIPVEQNVRIRPGDVKYAMLPVWLLSTQYEDKNYLFAMNGQTGKIVGNLPVDNKKLLLWRLGAFVAATLALGWLFL